MTYLPNLGIPDAALHVAEACRLLDDAVTAAGLAGAPAWESEAAEAYRAELAETRERMAADRGTLDDLRRAVAGVS